MSIEFSFGGTEMPCEADTITAVEFDDSGSYLATADCGGRCVVFKTTDSDINHKPICRRPPSHGPSSTSRDISSAMDKSLQDTKDPDVHYSASASAKALENGGNADEAPQEKGVKDSSEPAQRRVWVPYHQFQSHEAEFDFLKSLDIEAKVNQLRFVPSGSRRLILLSTNDKTIKLWRLSEKQDYSCQCVNSLRGVRDGEAKPNLLQLPRKIENTGIWSTASLPLDSHLKRTFHDAHTYHVNSLSLNADSETFISADDLRINLWNLEQPEKCLNIIDRKPSNMEDLNEIITCSTFHPEKVNMMAFSTSKGQINVADLRTSSLCRESDYLQMKNTPSTNSEFSGAHMYSELMASVLDIKFASDGRHLASRDYLTIKLWDINMPHEPVRIIPLHNHLKPLLPQLYETESIFDKFTVNFSPCAKRIVTGGYNNIFTIRDVSTGDQVMEGQIPQFFGPDRTAGGITKISAEDSEAKYEQMDIRTDQRVIHCAWHPHDATLAVAGVAGLHIYHV